MWDVRVCAACLATDVRMYSMSAARLLEPYRLLTGIELEDEGMPQKLCWECAALVHKFNKFRHKCERASLLLQDIYNQHDEVSEQEVLRVNREQHSLISSYTICPIQAYNLSSIKTKGEKCDKDKTSEAKKTNDKQTNNAQVYPSVKLELEIIKKEVPIEMKSEVDNTEQIDEVFVEEDCSQAVQLELPQKIKRVRKRRQGSKLKQKKERRTAKVLAKDFGMKEELLSQEKQMEVMRERQNTEGYRLARFPCTLCYNPFNMEKTLNNHMLKHNPVSGEFVCDLCKLRYKTRNLLHKHITSHHMNKYSCQSCAAVFYNRWKAKMHSAWHKGVVYTCHVCGASFNKKTTQMNHIRRRHSSEHVCDQCGEQFHSKKGLLCHIHLTHKLQRDTVISGGDQETSGPYCAECDIQFTCKQAWTRHVLISPKHQHERHICALGCVKCGETLPDKKSMRAHQVIHRKIHRKIHQHTQMTHQPITCEQCGEAMENNRAYHAHFRREHRDKTRTHYPAMSAPCMCELCGKVFHCRALLKEHSYVHTDEPRYQCDVCRKSCRTKESLKLHIRSHTKEAPCKCDICGRGFSRPSNLTRHKLVHTDATPYACKICGKCFKYRDSLKYHSEYVHMKKPPPKRDRSKRQNDNERRSRGHKRSHEEAVAE